MLRKYIFIISTTLMLLGAWSLGFSAEADFDQNEGSDNLSYDLVSKFYAGFEAGYSVFSNYSAAVSGVSTELANHSANFGAFAGYKFNDYVALEVGANRLGYLESTNNPASIVFSYSASVYSLGLTGVLSYPILIRYPYTLSAFGSAGYGLNLTDYNYNAENVQNSGVSTDAAYHLGFGCNLDFRVNFSVRIGYTYYQASYPLPGHSSDHGANVVSLGIYYNFI